MNSQLAARSLAHSGSDALSWQAWASGRKKEEMGDVLREGADITFFFPQ